MKITFNVDYRTAWGEWLYITGDIDALAQGNEAEAPKMEFDGNDKWTLTIEVPDDTIRFDFRYFIRHENGYTKREWGKPHHFVRGRQARTYEIFDRWQDQPWDKPYYASAFTDCVNRRDSRDEELLPRSGYVMLKVQAPMVASDEVVAICGGCDTLGAWDAGKALVMNDHEYPVWSINIEYKSLDKPCEYKFLILKKDTREVVAWEGGGNRVFNIIPDAKNAAIIDAGQRLINPKTPWKGAGVAIPVFSIRTADDFGAGDFADLKAMTDWAVATGQKFIQILPINDTTMTGTWTDSYPYNANSTFALHPMYLRLSDMGRLSDPARQAYFDNLGKELNELETVDYERVNNAKRDFTRELFAEQGAATLESDDFKAFLERNAYWLTPYAAFCVLRDINGTPVMSRWGRMQNTQRRKWRDLSKATRMR